MKITVEMQAFLFIELSLVAELISKSLLEFSGSIIGFAAPSVNSEVGGVVAQENLKICSWKSMVIRSCC